MFDFQKTLSKLPSPKKGWVFPGDRYLGPLNDFDSQVDYNRKTGEIYKIHDKPSNRLDEIAMIHDIDYSLCGDILECKNLADDKMVRRIDSLPNKTMKERFVRFLINTKKILGWVLKIVIFVKSAM